MTSTTDAVYRGQIQAAIRRGLGDTTVGDHTRDLVRAIADQILTVPLPTDPNAAIVARANDTLTMVAGVLGTHEHRAKTPDGTINTKAARCIECGELLLLSHRLNAAGFLRWLTWDEYRGDSWPSLVNGVIV